jgi:hypothetical protein
MGDTGEDSAEVIQEWDGANKSRMQFVCDDSVK